MGVESQEDLRMQYTLSLQLGMISKLQSRQSTIPCTYPLGSAQDQPSGPLHVLQLQAAYP